MPNRPPLSTERPTQCPLCDDSAGCPTHGAERLIASLRSDLIDARADLAEYEEMHVRAVRTNVNLLRMMSAANRRAAAAEARFATALDDVPSAASDVSRAKNDECCHKSRCGLPPDHLGDCVSGGTLAASRPV